MRGAEWTEKDEYKQQPDAKRFEDWEFAYATVIGSSEAIKYCLNIGEEKIWKQIKLLTTYMRLKLSQINNVKVLDRGPALGGSVTFTATGSTPDYIVNELLKRKINAVASFRNYAVIDFDEKQVEWAIRVSPHYYNTIDEIDEFMIAIKTILP
jgi:selenocysteine lyase/cysteine desulfurase